jgi:hypothetical protein
MYVPFYRESMNLKSCVLLASASQSHAPAHSPPLTCRTNTSLATISVVVGTPIALALGCCLVYAPDLFVFLMVFWILILTKGPLVIMGAIILFFFFGSLFGQF